MKGCRKKTFVVLRFAAGCLSQSSIDVDENQPKKWKSETSPPMKRRRVKEKQCKEGMKRLMRSMNSFFGLFVHKAEVEEEEESKMEIGYPTDVKHLTHIGLDGKITNRDAPKNASAPSVSLKHYEIAMSAQSCDRPLVLNFT